METVPLWPDTVNVTVAIDCQSKVLMEPSDAMIVKVLLDRLKLTCCAAGNTPLVKVRAGPATAVTVTDAEGIIFSYSLT
jgi:hypothetical protein